MNNRMKILEILRGVLSKNFSEDGNLYVSTKGEDAVILHVLGEPLVENRNLYEIRTNDKLITVSLPGYLVDFIKGGKMDAGKTDAQLVELAKTYNRLNVDTFNSVLSISGNEKSEKQLRVEGFRDIDTLVSGSKRNVVALTAGNCVDLFKESKERGVLFSEFVPDHAKELVRSCDSKNEKSVYYVLKQKLGEREFTKIQTALRGELTEAARKEIADEQAKLLDGVSKMEGSRRGNPEVEPGVLRAMKNASKPVGGRRI